MKEIRRAYGFDEVAIVPGHTTVNPELADTSFSIDGTSLSVPILAAGMDAVVSPDFAVRMHELGGLAVMNLEGVQTRFDEPAAALERIVSSPQEEVTALLQKVYSTPVKEELIGVRIEEMKRDGAKCAVSVTPANTKRLAPIAADAGADIIAVQSTVTTVRHRSRSVRGLRFPELLEMVNVPVIVGNCVSYDVALETHADRHSRSTRGRRAWRGVHYP